MPSKKLDSLRKKVDAIDSEILDALSRRASIVCEIGQIKRESGAEVYDPVREKLLLDRLVNRNKGRFPSHALRVVFGEILSASRAIQSPLKVAYLGPEATFTHLATIKSFGKSTELVPQSSISKVFDAVEHSQATCGVVPIENSTEGVVGATLDRFLDSPLKISGEIAIPISHFLLTRSGTLSSIRRIYSHPQAIAQCRAWIEESLPRAVIVETESTARSAEKAAEDPQAAGIASEYAAELYGLKILKRNIEDNPNNMTRFLILSRKETAPSGRDKTSILFSVRDEVGVLYRMLEPFYQQHINLTKIESRPIKKKAWQYIFFLDMDGHFQDKKISSAIRSLEKRCHFLKVLGSYPKAT